MHHDRGELIELVGVVDHHQRRSPGRRAERGHRAAHALSRVGAQVPEQPLERPEGGGPGGGRRVGPAEGGALWCRALHRFAGQPGLPDSGRAGEHDPAGRPLRTQRPRHEPELLVPADERPRQNHGTRLQRTLAAEDLRELRGGHLQERPHSLRLHPQYSGDPLAGLALVAEAKCKCVDRGQLGQRDSPAGSMLGHRHIVTEASTRRSSSRLRNPTDQSGTRLGT